MNLIEREKLKLQLIRHEGVELLPYEDSVGKWTIGCGRNLTDVGISHDEALFLLENDIDACLADLKTWPWFEALDVVRQRVLLDMRFNLGAAGLRKFKNTLAAVARGDYDAAARGMRGSKWAMQVGERARRLAEMMRTGHDSA